MESLVRMFRWVVLVVSLFGQTTLLRILIGGIWQKTISFDDQQIVSNKIIRS